jgi:hypothetical protein
MTRISASVKPVELCDKMLMAEHREILRIPNAIKNGKAKVDFKKIPLKFKLGTGHVMFFYNKIKYLEKRYHKLYNECIDRGFNVQYYGDCFEDIPSELYKDWSVESHVRPLLVERINERLSTMKNIKYCSENVSLDEMKIN